MRQVLFVLDEVLDFDDGVVGEAGKFAMQRCDEGKGVADAVEKIGIAERDVLRASGNLLADVREDDFAIHDTKHAVVNGDNGTVAAEMFAAAAGFGEANGAVFAGGQNQMRV